jgi:hypothetical protein
VLGDQDSLAPLVHCLRQGCLDGGVELAFHAGSVGCGDRDGEVDSCSQWGCDFLVSTISGFNGIAGGQLSVPSAGSVEFKRRRVHFASAHGASGAAVKLVHAPGVPLRQVRSRSAKAPAASPRALDSARIITRAGAETEPA